MATSPDDLVLENLDWAQQVAVYISGRYRPSLRDDLASEAVVGLIDAARRFNPSNRPGVGFRQFAYRRIVGQMKDYLRANACVIRTPRRRLNRVQEPMPAAFALSEPDRCDGLAAKIIRLDFESLVRGLLPQERDQEIILLRYGADMNQDEISDAIGMSQPRVSQEHSRIINRLRKTMSAHREAV